ncbi:unnamed protein product, partial [Prorocentrum cordatum]
VSGAPLADASARVPVSPLQPPFLDPMAYAAGLGLGSPGFADGFGAGVYCPGAPLLPAGSPPPGGKGMPLPAAQYQYHGYLLETARGAER